MLAAQDKAEEGLALLAGDVQPAFLSGREELKGDLLVQAGPYAATHAAAYEKARAALPRQCGGSVTLQIKLDDLAEAETSDVKRWTYAALLSLTVLVAGCSSRAKRNCRRPS